MIRIKTQQFTRRKIIFMIARPSSLLKYAFQMDVIKRHCTEDKVEVNSAEPILRYMLSFSRVAFSFRGKGNVSKADI